MSKISDSDTLDNGLAKSTIQNPQAGTEFASLELLKEGGINISDKTRQMIPVQIETHRCKPWKYHNRDTAWLNLEHCSDLISSITKHGQFEPVLVRKLKDNQEYDFEIIYGVRRWFACSQINERRLWAYVTDLDDKSCTILMHAENADSKDITEFERAFSFAEQLKSNIFKNQTEIAEAIGVTQGTISKMIKAAEILNYEWISKLFRSKMDIPIKYAYALSVLLKKPECFEIIKKEAQQLYQEKEKTDWLPSSTHILKRLINQSKPINNEPLESIELIAGDKAIVSSRKDKFGKVSIIIDNEAKYLKRSDIEAACLNAINKLVFLEEIF